MDLVNILTIAAIVLANIGTIIGLFTWATNHAANDAKELRALNHEASIRTDKLISAIHQEMIDFHGRLCAIEERNRSK